MTLVEATVPTSAPTGLKSRLPLSDRRGQAAALMMQRITGDVTVKELAAETGISERTVRRRLELARQDDTIAIATHTVFAEELLPKAVSVLRKALDGDDLKLAVTVAIKIIDGLKILHADPSTPDTRPREELSLERWREGRTLTHTIFDPPGAAPPDAPADGAVVEGLSLPPDLAGPGVAEAAPDSAPPGSRDGDNRVEAGSAAEPAESSTS